MGISASGRGTATKKPGDNSIGTAQAQLNRSNMGLKANKLSELQYQAGHKLLTNYNIWYG